MIRRTEHSRLAAEVLSSHRVDFDYVDVLEEPALRKAMASRWPTFPQLWAEGVLLGGADALRELAASGDLLDALRSSTARERASMALLLKPLRRGNVAAAVDPSSGAVESI